MLFTDRYIFSVWHMDYLWAFSDKFWGLLWDDTYDALCCHHYFACGCLLVDIPLQVLDFE